MQTLYSLFGQKGQIRIPYNSFGLRSELAKMLRIRPDPDLQTTTLDQGAMKLTKMVLYPFYFMRPY